MKAQNVQIRENQKEIWNRFSPGWKKWNDQTMSFLKPLSDEIIHLIKPKRVDFILDVASGTGEPGLTIATKLRGGVVVLTDLSKGMLEVARENAARRGIKNLEFVNCDVTELPFPDNSFDSVSCRLGFMFFPDMIVAAKEMVRVLKPDGSLATAVWDVPEKNFWADAIMSVINQNIPSLSPPDWAPGLFRCSNTNFMSGLFKEAGLKKISEKVVPGKLKLDSAEVYWNYMTEVAAPVVAALDKANKALKLKIKREVLELINKKYQNGKVSLESSALLIYGAKS